MKKTIIQLLSSAALLAPAAAIAQSAPSDFTSATRYDLEHRVVGTIAPDPDGTGPLHYPAARNTYDLVGRLVKVEEGELASWQSEAIAPVSWSGFSPHQKVETSYDTLDRKVKEMSWGWNAGTSAWDLITAVQYSYDTVGRLQCTAVRMNPALFGSLPASACEQSNVSNPIDRITKNVYDDAGQLLQVREAAASDLEQAYVTYSYTPNGKQEYVVDANGNKARLVYDEYDRQTQWQFPSASALSGFNSATPATAMATAGAVNVSDYEQYGYDANGNRISLRKRDGRVLGFTYDALNRMTVKTVPDCPGIGSCCPSSYVCSTLTAAQTRDVYYSYDMRGLQIAARFDSVTGGDAVINTYDGLGRMATTTTSMSGSSRTLTFWYDPNGNRVQIMHPDGVWFTSTYDGLDRLIYMSLNGGTLAFGATFNADGNRDSLWRGAGRTNYSYDGVGRLTVDYQIFGASAGTHNLYTTYSYNPASQVVSRTRDNPTPYAYGAYTPTTLSYAPDGLNRYATVGGNSYSYDSNGNLTSDGGIAYTYDVENRLVASSSGTNLVYDPLGRLQQISSGSTDTRFLYDGDELIAEYDAAGNLLARYVHGENEDDPVVRYVGAGVSAPQYLYSDNQGSIIAIVDAGGNVVKVNTYDEYGVPGSGNGGRFQYTGQAWIPELGMYYYKARIYSPMLGRFMQADPIGYKDQVNLYAYAANDPVNNLDSSGMATGSVIPGVTPSFLYCSGNCSVYSSSITYDTRKPPSARPSAQPGNGGGACDSKVPLIKPCAHYLPFREQTLQKIRRVHFRDGPSVKKSIFLSNIDETRISTLYAMAALSNVPVGDPLNPRVAYLTFSAPMAIGFVRNTDKFLYSTLTHDITFVLYIMGKSPDGHLIYLPSNAYPGLPGE